MSLPAYIIRTLVFFTTIQTCCAYPAAEQIHTTPPSLLLNAAISSKTLHALREKYTALQEKMDKQSAGLLNSTHAKKDRLKRKMQYTRNTTAQNLLTDDAHRTDLQTKLTAFTERLQSLRAHVQSIEVGLQHASDIQVFVSTKQSNFKCLRGREIKFFNSKFFTV